MRTLLILFFVLLTASAQPVFPPSFWAPATAAASNGSPGYDTGVTNSTHNASSITLTATASGQNNLAIVYYSGNNVDPGAVTVTNNSVAFTQAIKTNAGGGYAYVFYLVNPGSANSVISIPSISYYQAASMIIVTNANQSTPIGTVIADYSASSRKGTTNSPASASGDLVVDTMHWFLSGTVNPGSNQTKRQLCYTASANNSSAFSTAVGQASSTSMSWTNDTSEAITWIGFAVKAR